MLKRNLVTAGLAAMMIASTSAANAADLYVDPSMPSLSSVMSAYVGGGFLSNTDDGDFDEDAYIFYGGDARVAGESWQLEIVGAANGNTDEDEDSDDLDGGSMIAGAAHWLSRGDASTWGVFGAVSHTNLHDTEEVANHFFGGLEFAMFQANTTLFAQAGGVVCVAGDCSDTWESGGFGRVGLRFFPTDHQKLQVDFLGGVGDLDPGDDGEDAVFTAAWGVEYEHQFANGPFSAFAAYRGHYVEEQAGDPNDEVTSHGFLVGVRIDVGTDSLRQRDVSGAGTFDLPDVFRAFAWPDQL